jgi:L-lactate permease
MDLRTIQVVNGVVKSVPLVEGPNVLLHAVEVLTAWLIKVLMRVVAVVNVVVVLFVVEVLPNWLMAQKLQDNLVGVVIIAVAVDCAIKMKKLKMQQNNFEMFCEKFINIIKTTTLLRL